jgi:hypothetical protein
LWVIIRYKIKKGENTMTKEERRERIVKKVEKVFELLNYLVLALLIIGQCTVGSNYLWDSLYT